MNDEPQTISLDSRCRDVPVHTVVDMFGSERLMHDEDLTKISNAFLSIDYWIEPVDAARIWRAYSMDRAASWITLPSSNEDILNALDGYWFVPGNERRALMSIVEYIDTMENISEDEILEIKRLAVEGLGGKR